MTTTMASAPSPLKQGDQVLWSGRPATVFMTWLTTPESLRRRDRRDGVVITLDDTDEMLGVWDGELMRRS